MSALLLFGTWSLVFHGALVLKQPDQVYVWLGVCEVGSLSIAGLACLASTLTNPVLIQGARLGSRVGFGLCAVVFGISHFAYNDVTAAMVPAWLGIPHVWAGLTGAGHLAAGLALVSGVQARLAAGIEAAMCGVFVLLLHVPRVIATPASQMEWTMLCIATAIGGAAWVVRSQVTVNS